MILKIENKNGTQYVPNSKEPLFQKEKNLKRSSFEDTNNFKKSDDFQNIPRSLKSSDSSDKNVEKRKLAERIMQELTNDLKDPKNKINLNNKKNEDGRVNSARNEAVVVKAIQNSFQTNSFYKEQNLKLLTPNITNNREWYDVAIQGQDIFIPINIKISVLSNTCDNLNCKTGLVYALTGKTPKELNISNMVGWEKYGELFIPYVSTEETGTDYYFLIVNKKDPSDVFWNSLKHLSILSPNGSNLPFQCSFKKNRTPNNVSQKEAVRYILSSFNQSLLKDIVPKQKLSNLLCSSKLFN